MKPSFALQFTEGGMTLLHRTGRGWLPLGDAALDDPGMADNLGYLRATALGLEPQGITTKLVIPNGQILYTMVDAPAPEPGKRRNQIRRALEGRTPYAVEDLVFDWSGSGPSVMVAVVPRDTLAEAEAFALEHRFNPMGFVAAPEPGIFDGEPFFGPSAHATASLAPGEKVERDRAVMRIIGRGDGAKPAGARVTPPVVPDVAVPETAVPVVVAQTELPLAEALPVAADPVAADPVAEPMLAVPVTPTPEPEPVGPEPVGPEPAEPVPVAAAATLTAMDPLVTSLIAAAEADLDLDFARAEPGSGLIEPLTERTAPPAERVAPFPLPITQFDEVPEAPAMFDVPMDDSDLPAMPHSMAAFASRRNEAVTAAAVAGGEARQPSLGPARQPASVTAPVLPATEAEKPAAPPPRAGGKADGGKADGGKVGLGKVSDPRAKLAATARNGAQPGSMARYVPMKGKGSAAAGRANPEAAALGGKPDTDFSKHTLGRRPPVRGKPKYLGLTLTLLLVLVLGAVAIWSNYYLGSERTVPAADPAAENSSPAATDSAEAAAEPAPADSALPLADTAQSDVLVEPPEADPAAAEPATVNAAAGDSVTTDTAPETAAAEPASATPSDAAVLSDATLSTMDQPGQADPGAASTADPMTATAEGAVVPPAPDTATAKVAPAADPAASAAATSKVQPDPAAVAATESAPETAAEITPETATKTPTITPADPATETATVTAAAPAPEPPATAPQAETSATAALTGQLLDQGDRLPELQASDSGLQTFGPAQLAEPLALAGESRPDTPLPPAPFGTFFDRDAKGWVIATPEGAVTPEGALVIAGRPDLIPPRRPVQAGTAQTGTAQAGTAQAGTAQAATETATGAADPPAPPDTGAAAVRSDPALARARPKPRPPSPGGTLDGTELRIEPQIATASTARPRPRPATALAQALPDTGQGFATATDQAIAVSSRPAQRPADIAGSVAAALASLEPQAPAPVAEPAADPAAEPNPDQVVAAIAPLPRPAVPEPDPQPQAAAPEADNEPEVSTAMPAIPQNASVARQATLANAINLGKINLIGVYGTPSDRRALVRLASGRYVRVQVGDRVDGGQVAAISEQELRYIKNGRNVVLALPKDS